MGYIKTSTVLKNKNDYQLLEECSGKMGVLRQLVFA
jgi:hypothetical protein